MAFFKNEDSSCLEDCPDYRADASTDSDQKVKACDDCSYIFLTGGRAHFILRRVSPAL